MNKEESQKYSYKSFKKEDPELVQVLVRVLTKDTQILEMQPTIICSPFVQEKEELLKLHKAWALRDLPTSIMCLYKLCRLTNLGP